jgi:hypothetical protein
VDKWNVYANGTAANYFAGSVLIGTTTPITFAGTAPAVQVRGATAAGSWIGLSRNSADQNGPSAIFGKERAGAIVNLNDTLGLVQFTGFDGAAYLNGALIRAEVDGTPGTNAMPGRLVFSTTASASATPTERLRITSAGDLLIGTTTNTNSTRLTVAGEISETTNSVQYKLVNQSDIGTAPNEIPLNGYLGPLAFRDQLLVSVPASATATGNVGDVAADASFIYVCIAPNSWVRATAAAW